MNTINVINEYNRLAEQVKGIVHETFDYTIESVCDMEVSNDGTILVGYVFCSRGCRDGDSCSIPIKWLEVGFDYKAAYAELVERQRASAEKQAKEDAKRAKAEKERRERAQYERLKKKYEGSAV